MYAVGVVLHLMLTGQHPRSYARFGQHDAPPQSEPQLVFQVFVPEDLRSIVMQMVNVEADQRPMLSEVRTVLGGFA